jgi:uncharacterized protein
MNKLLINKSLLLALSFCFLILFADKAESADPKSLTIGTANTGGAYYPIGKAMADLLTNKLGIKTTAQTTGGAVENNTLIEKGKVDIAITHGSLAFHALNGNDPYSTKHQNLMLMFSGLSKGVFQVIVKDDSRIKTINDLKGKKIVLGPIGGAAIVMTKDVLGAFGMSFNDIKPFYVSYDDGVNDMMAGIVDAVVVQSAIPSPAILQLKAAKRNIRLISIDDNSLDTLLKKYSFYSKIKIPKDQYGLTQEISTVYVNNIVVVSKTLSTDLVYKMTRLFFENADRIVKSHPAAKELTLENAVKSIPIPIHPGAAKYFKEKGYNVK